jgi:hypothetical protein
MTFDPDDFQDQAAIAAMLQRQKMINSQNQQKSIPKNRKCPWCGGGLPGQYSKCQYCASELSWVDGFPCKPQEEEKRRRESLEKWEKAKKQEALLIEKEKKLKDEIAARVVVCRKCGCSVPQLDMKSTIDTCENCTYDRQTKNYLIVYVLIAIALLALLIYYCIS